MKISVNKAKNLFVYKNGDTEPWGVCDGVITEFGGKKIDAICVRTLSLIPTCRSIKISDIAESNGMRVVLKKDCRPAGVASADVIRAKQQIKNRENVGEGKRHARLDSLCFDTESGEITDITVLGANVGKKKKISINKIWVKENTIYIE